MAMAMETGQRCLIAWIHLAVLTTTILGSMGTVSAEWSPEPAPLTKQQLNSLKPPSWSYSTTGGQVNGRQIALSPLLGSLHAYTHYLVPNGDSLLSTNFSSYSFTVQVRGDGRSGMFISAWELGDKDKNETSKKKPGKKEEAVPNVSPICSNYQIQLSYPQDRNKSSISLCTANGTFTDSLVDILRFGEYEGPGSVIVHLEQRNMVVQMPKWMLAWQPKREGDEETKIGPWKRGDKDGSGASSWPSIPAEAVGGLTFTLYTDCGPDNAKGKGVAGMDTIWGRGFRPCSLLHNSTCIDSTLFCNSEPNCVPTLWELVLAAATKEYATAGVVNGSTNVTVNIDEAVDALTSLGYDESESACGGTSQLYWHRTTTTYRYTYTTGTRYIGSSGGGSGMWVMWGFLVLILGIGSLVRRATKASTSGDTTRGVR